MTVVLTLAQHRKGQEPLVSLDDAVPSHPPKFRPQPDKNTLDPTIVFDQTAALWESYTKPADDILSLEMEMVDVTCFKD
ncbi:hypothetical protein SLEP1_g1770 [Rubroshorea leprosula]|uniref:Uncharacterized protein n=1 Tax=Rubroshorea leprosula TaxID=152421 RepID=A0AAV5HNN1_9ROSI|nr:hypothetical protein SLEP1_g1770 [Rubroshorea leprosula]